MFLRRETVKIERDIYDNNLLFYTILKILVQCRLDEQKMVGFQSLLTKLRPVCNGDTEKLRETLRASVQVVKPDSASRNSYDNLISLLEADRAQMWLDMVDVGIDLLLFKDLILQESKSYAIARHQEIDREIADHLSIEYDVSNLSLPYGQRVLSSLLVSALTDVHRKKEFLLETSNRRVKQIYEKVNLLSDRYAVNCNNMLILIVDESVNQSIKSTAGASYEGRVEYMMQLLPSITGWEGHSHDENIRAMEYDFTFTFNCKRVGISAKRTLRERYKQNHEAVENLNVDYVLVFTLGTDLNEDKLNSLLQKDGTYVVVAKEIYDAKSYLKENPRVFSSEAITTSDDGAFLSKIIK